MRPIHALCLAAALGTACSDDGAADSGNATGRVRLLDHFETARIDSRWQPLSIRENGPTAGLTPELHADFETPPSDMHVYPLGRPFERDAPAGVNIPVPKPPTRNAAAAASGGQGLRFPEASGGALWWHPVQPDTPYQVDVHVRRMGPEDLDVPGVGMTLILELTDVPDLDAHGGNIWAALQSLPRAAQHRLVVTENGVFQHRSVVFRSTVFTKALVVFLVGGDPGWWLESDGDRNFAVDFDELQVHRLPLQRYLAVQDRTVQDDVRSFTELPDPEAPSDAWFLRKVKLVGDVRRGVLAPPTTRVQFPVTLPEGPYQLSLSYGVMDEQREQPPAPVRFQVWLESDPDAPPVLDRTLTPGVDADLGWHDLVHRDQGQGESVNLVMATNSVATNGDDPADLVAVFAEPTIVDLDPAQARGPNVILLSVDTLRADHLGCYGYRRADDRATSPNLDRLAREALLFEHARTVAPYTLPSHATMMTGLLPRVHGVEQVGSKLVSGVHPILAEQLASAGYGTAAFTGGGFVSHEHGFHHGFDRYSILDPMMSVEDPLRNDFPFPDARERNDAMYQRTGMDAVLRWIDGQDGAPFFLFLHTFLVHNYHAEKHREAEFVRADETGFTTSDRALHPLDLGFAAENVAPPDELLDTLRDLYDATIHEFDAHLARLEKHLRERGLWDRTVIVLTSDHGEEFGEHDGLLHGRTLYEEVLRIPLLVWGPGFEASRVPDPVDLTDVAPTILAAAGLAESLPRNGEDLRARVSRGDFEEVLWAEVNAVNLSRREACLVGGRKHLHNPDNAREEPGFENRRPPRFESFDLDADPIEQRNLWGRGPDFEPPPALAGLRRRHERTGQELLRQNQALVPDPSRLRTPITPDQLRRLTELGYTVDGMGELESEDR